MNWLTTVWIWIKFGWPTAMGVFDIVKDGKITRDEVELVMDKLFNGKREIVLFGPDSILKNNGPDEPTK